MSDYKTLTCAYVAVGDKLPSLDIDITTGLPDVFMNILTSQGLMTRFATDWSRDSLIALIRQRDA